MPEVSIQVPKSIMSLPPKDRDAILLLLGKAATLPKEMPIYHESSGDEHNIWDSNPDSLLGQAEDGLYEALSDFGNQRILSVFEALGLPVPEEDLQKAFEFDLLKAKGDRNRMSQLVHANKEKRDAFLKYMQDMNPFSKDQLKRLDALMRKRLPNYAKIAEDFTTRAGFIGKILNLAEREAFTMMGALIDRFPSTLQAARTKNVVLTLKEQKQAKAGRKVTVLPLTPLEGRAVEQASHHAADKMRELDERHAAAIRQVIMHAQRERWTPQQLAQELFRLFGDQNRDWRRVAITELAAAANDAYLVGCAEGDTVVGMGSDDACKHCKKHIIGKTFTVTHGLPKNTPEHDRDYVWPGKSNYGRKVDAYVPAIPLHPHCRCRWHKISRFYSVEKDGSFRLKSTAELIQEERARRGLPPDPNLK